MVLPSKKLAAMATNQKKMLLKSQASTAAVTDLGKLGQLQLQIFDEAELDAARLSAHGFGKPASDAFMTRLHAAGASRPLGRPGPDWKANLRWLSHVFPVFEEVVGCGVGPSVRAATLGALPRPTPLLVTGVEAQEVASFMRAVAKALDVAFFELDVVPMTSSACSRPGMVLTTLAFGSDSHSAVANPVGFSDLGFMDSRSEMQLAQCFGKLLRVDDAQMAHDPNAPGVHFDASFIRWILSCRDINRVPAEILNECHVIRVSPHRGS